MKKNRTETDYTKKDEENQKTNEEKIRPLKNRVEIMERIDKAELRKKIENSQTIEKGREGIAHVIFGRSMIIFALMLLQIILLFWGLTRLSEIWYAFSGIMTVLALVLVVHIINKTENPAYKLVWTVMILVVPLFGSAMYLFVEAQIGTKWINARLQYIHRDMKRYWAQKPEVMRRLAQEDEQMASLGKYVSESGGYSIYENTSAKYFPTGMDKFEELKTQLQKAEKFIFMEYFIVSKGYMWDSVLEILKEKAKEGVEVRFMYDGMNTVARLPYKYPEQLRSYGIQCHVFAHIRPSLSTRQNNRDHRKIVVIDGHTAFTGGINLADEYINRKERFGYWKDTGIMIQGEAVRSFTLMFLEMWNVERYDMYDTYDKYLTAAANREPKPGDGFVMPYGDSPVDSENVGETVYMDILNTAKRYVHIMTPYLILDNEMLTALKYAAKRGIDVKIIMPHIPDKWYAFVLAKTYYNELLESGVKIYEFVPGFVHAKSFTSDDEKAVVGTINLDYRSLYLHFECAVMLYRNEAVAAVEKDFQDTLDKCIAVTPDDFGNQPLRDQIAGKVFRLLAPLM